MPVPSASSKIIFTAFKFFWACSIFFQHSRIFWLWSKARFYLINSHIWAMSMVKNIWTHSKNIEHGQKCLNMVKKYLNLQMDLACTYQSFYLRPQTNYTKINSFYAYQILRPYTHQHFWIYFWNILWFWCNKPCSMTTHLRHVPILESVIFHPMHSDFWKNMPNDCMYAIFSKLRYIK